SDPVQLLLDRLLSKVRCHIVKLGPTSKPLDELLKENGPLWWTRIATLGDYTIEANLKEEVVMGERMFVADMNVFDKMINAINHPRLHQYLGGISRVVPLLITRVVL